MLLADALQQGRACFERQAWREAHDLLSDADREAPLAPEDEPLNIVTFTEVDGRTTLEILVQTTSRELRDMIVGSGMEAGMQESLDALEQVAVSLR